MKRNVRQSPRTAAHQGRRGAALVELALVLPIFLALVFGIVGFGHAFLVTHALAAAARDGARLGVVLDHVQADDARIKARVDDVLQPVNVKDAQVTNDQPIRRGDPLTVTVSLQYKPIIGDAIGFVGLPSTLPLKETAVMRCEQCEG